MATLGAGKEESGGAKLRSILRGIWLMVPNSFFHTPETHRTGRLTHTARHFARPPSVG